MTIDKSIQLEVSKAVEQLAFVDRSYGLRVWPNEESKQAWKHDLGLMRAFGDLDHVRLELLAADKSVLCEFRINFNGKPNGQGIVDHADGVELPLLHRHQIADSRVIVQHRERNGQYRHLLHLKWATAETLRRRPGAAYDSEHASKITGGRQTGRFHVGNEARHNLVITHAGRRNYAFARDLDLRVNGVFLHRTHAPAGVQFQPGMRITAVVVQTPLGFQARNIQLA